MKITKRDIRVFVLGMLAFLAFESIYNWEESKEAFMRGWNESTNPPISTAN
jgi:hypothetical protein